MKTADELIEAFSGPPESPRTCAYCGEHLCHHSYSKGRMGKRSLTVENTSDQTTAEEMQDTFALWFARIKPRTPGTWKLSWTELDENKLEKARAKRNAAKEGSHP